MVTNAIRHAVPPTQLAFIQHTVDLVRSLTLQQLPSERAKKPFRTLIEEKRLFG